MNGNQIKYMLPAMVEALYFAFLIIAVASYILGFGFPIDIYDVFMPLFYYVLVTPFYLSAFSLGSFLSMKSAKSDYEKIKGSSAAIMIGFLAAVFFYYSMIAFVFGVLNQGAGEVTVGSPDTLKIQARFMDGFFSLTLVNIIALGMNIWFHAPRLIKVFDYVYLKKRRRGLARQVDSMVAPALFLFLSGLLFFPAMALAFIPMILLMILIAKRIPFAFRLLLAISGMAVFAYVMGNATIYAFFKANFQFFLAALCIISFCVLNIWYMISKSKGGRD